MLLRENDNLTQVDTACGGSAAITHKGQAHFADLSVGHQCQSCEDLVSLKKRKGLYCQRFREMVGKWGRPVPPEATACKYYKARR